jgi:hypothetical protein
MPSYPKDRFDELPEDLKRVGAHRSPRKRGRGWIAFAWAALATGVLVFAGLFGLSKFLGVDIGLPIFQAGTSSTPTPTPTPTPTAEPVLDPTGIAPDRNIKIAVLNGTTAAGLQNVAGDALAGAGWPIDSRSRASEQDIEKTTVYYSDPLNEDVARGLVVAMSVGQIRLVPADTYPGTAITIVLGADYPGAVPQ